MFNFSRFKPALNWNQFLAYISRGSKFLNSSSDFSSFRFQDRFLAVGDLGGRIESLDIEVKKEVWGLRGHEVRQEGRGERNYELKLNFFNVFPSIYIFFFIFQVVNCIDGAGGKGSGAYEILSGGACIKFYKKLQS